MPVRRGFPPKALLPWLGLALSLVMVLTAWLLLRRAQVRRLHDRFEAEAALLQVRVADRVAAHEQILRGVAEFISRRQGLPTRQEWHHLAQTLDLDHNNPGVQALGFAQWIPMPELGRHIRRLRAEGFPDYEVHPGGPLPPEGGVSSIIYTEPFDALNRKTFAKDMLAEANRKQAMVQARDTGAVTLSGKLRLYQEGSDPVQAGTVLFVPVYRSGSPTGSVGQRRAALMGWAYMAFRMGNLLKGTLGEPSQGIRLELFDGDSEREEDLLYAGSGFQPVPGGSWVNRTHFAVAGRVWTLLSVPDPAFGNAPEGTGRTAILALGLLFSGAIFGLLRSFARGERQARTMADERLSRVQELLDSTGEAIYGIDMNGECTFCNPALLRMMGYERADQVLGRNMHDLIHHSRPDGSPMPVAQCRIFKAFREGAGTHADDEVLWRADGSSFPAEYGSYPQYRDGRVVGAVVTFVDISERKRSEAAVRKITVAVDQSPVAVVITDVQGRIEYVNPKFTQMTGYTAAEAMGQNPRILKSGDYPPEAYRDMWTTIAAGEIWKGEFHNRKRDGELFWESATIAPIRDGAGTITHFVAIKEDITESKRAELERRKLEARLQQAQRMESLGILAAGVAHNINNVLAIILGTASLRAQSATDPADAKAYATIDKVCIRGRDVVKSLMQFGQPSAPSQVPFELNLMVREVRTLLENTTRNTVRVVEDLVAEPVWISGDSGGINHALLNLCLNALDAMPDGGTLTFRTALPGDGWAELSVEDTGCGMEPEVLAHVMEPFFTTKAVDKGTGLGLSMTYGVVKAHGGILDFSSRPGQGTVARIRIPRRSAPAAPEGPAEAPARDLGSLRVLLVDDDVDVQVLMSRMLRKAGVRKVRTLSSGQEALEVLRAGEPPSLVILDQNMPGLNGSQTLKRIRKLHPDLPVLISSGQPGLEERPEFSQPGVGVISKPFTLDEIRNRLARFQQLQESLE